jgi:hypothetical protein
MGEVRQSRAVSHPGAREIVAPALLGGSQPDN